jgi:hypothetical protein
MRAAALATPLLLLAACTPAPEPAAPPRHATAPTLKITCPHIPPPPAGEKPPLPPVSAFPQMLLPGHQEWSDGAYSWIPPHWETRFSTTTPPKWIPGYWEVNSNACIWHNGHVQAPRPQAE